MLVVSPQSVGGIVAYSMPQVKARRRAAGHRTAERRTHLFLTGGAEKGRIRSVGRSIAESQTVVMAGPWEHVAFVVLTVPILLGANWPGEWVVVQWALSTRSPAWTRLVVGR